MTLIDIPYQFLKTGVRGTGQDAYDNVYHYPTEMNYEAIGNYLQQNPNSTLGNLVSPYLQGQFTNNPTNVTTNPPSYQSERPTQFQSTVAAPFPQTPEQVQGVERLIESGFENYKARANNPQKPHYDSMVNAVRVLSGRLRGNPAFDFKPRGFRPRRGQRAVGRTRSLQNLKTQSMLDTPVNPVMAEMFAAPRRGIPISTGEPMDIAMRLLKGEFGPTDEEIPSLEDFESWYNQHYKTTPQQAYGSGDVEQHLGLYDQNYYNPSSMDKRITEATKDALPEVVRNYSNLSQFNQAPIFIEQDEGNALGRHLKNNSGMGIVNLLAADAHKVADEPYQEMKRTMQHELGHGIIDNALAEYDAHEEMGHDVPQPLRNIADWHDDDDEGLVEELPHSIYDKDLDRSRWNTVNQYYKKTGAPMDIAMRLLKGSTRQSTLWGYDPKMVENLLAEDNSNIFIAAKPGNDDMPDDEQNERSDKMLQDLAALKEEHGHFDITSATGRAQWDAEPSFMLTNVPDSARDSINEIAERYGQESMGISEKGEKGVNYVTPEGEVKDKFSSMEMQENPEYSTDFPSSQRLAFTGWQEANKANPMHIAFQLLKERKSPAAFAHKLEYDKQYQKDPKRVKYREQLNAERRKRGIYGKGGKDVSHTQGGKLTLESAHANRARHFKNRGTLRRVKVR